MLVDDHPLVRQGIRSLVDNETDLLLAAELSGVHETKRYLENCVRPPDVAIIDLSLKDGDGVQLVVHLTRNFPKVQSLVVSMHDESVYADRCVRSGAKGYIMKSEPPAELIRAIRAVAQGKTWFSEKAMTSIIAKQFFMSPMTTQLTPREREILKLIGAGYQTHDIANSLGLSPRTVNSHKENLKQKLDLGSTTQLMIYARENAADDRLGS